MKTLKYKKQIGDTIEASIILAIESIFERALQNSPLGKMFNKDLIMIIQVRFYLILLEKIEKVFFQT